MKDEGITYVEPWKDPGKAIEEKSEEEKLDFFYLQKFVKVKNVLYGRRELELNFMYEIFK